MNQSNHYELEIILRSDMCCGTGAGNGIDVDIRTAFDEMGFPIIPAKRLKGLLRECAKLMVKHKRYKEEDFISLFGDEGGKEGRLHIGNAALKESSVLKKELPHLEGELAAIVTKEAISNVYTIARTQTAVNPDGTAKKTSLRKMEAIKKNNTFYASIKVSAATDEDGKKLEDCAKLLRGVGMNRNRGFGEVSCILKEIGKTAKKASYCYKKQDEIITKRYRVELLEDIVMSAGSNGTPDFISGGMMMGAFARYGSQYDWFSEVILNNTIFSNAYLGIQQKENQEDEFAYFPMYPTPLCFHTVKNEEETIYDLSDSDNRNESQRYVSVGGYHFVEGNQIVAEKVKTQLEYHHAKKMRQIYQYQKIRKGQAFCGEITGDKGALEVLEELLWDHENLLSFGGSATAQYSTCRMYWQKEERQEQTIQMEDKMLVEFLSDVIVLNPFGSNTGEVKDLKAAMRDEVSFKECVIFSKTKMIGGFNRKWQLPKRQYIAFVKGTVLALSGCEKKERTDRGRIGLLTNEGYGAYRLRTVGCCEYNVVERCDLEKEQKVEQEISQDSLSDCTLTLIKEICFQESLEAVRVEALKSASEIKLNDLSASAAMRLLTIYLGAEGEKGFLQYFSDYNFGVNEALKEMSEEIIQRFKNIRVEIPYWPQIQEEKRDQLFGEYFRYYVNQVKIIYQRRRHQ